MKLFLITLILLVMAPVNLFPHDSKTVTKECPICFSCVPEIVYSAAMTTDMLCECCNTISHLATCSTTGKDFTHRYKECDIVRWQFNYAKADSVRKEWEQLATFPFYTHRPDSVIDLPMRGIRDSILPVCYAPLNTRLQITWLDSVAVMKCKWRKMFAEDTLSRMRMQIERNMPPDSIVLLFLIDSTWACDTISWRMTELSLSEIKEGE